MTNECRNPNDEETPLTAQLIVIATGPALGGHAAQPVRGNPQRLRGHGRKHGRRRGPHLEGIGRPGPGWKYVFDGIEQLEMLFDLESDPGERHTLSYVHPDIVREPGQSLEAWEQDVDRHISRHGQ
jgi:hypothetical protein